MPFPMKIQPIDAVVVSSKPVVKSRLKRLFDRPLLRVSSTTKFVGDGGGAGEFRGGEAAEFEPSSVCLDKMVRNFIEENNEKPPVMTTAAKCGRNRCNCFHVSNNDNSDDEFGFESDTLKSLIPCRSNEERNLLSDASIIVEKNKGCKRKDDLRRIMTQSLISLNYDAAICKSKWDKSSTIPAGEYEYIDVIIEDERIIIDVDFRSEFEIARSTASYKAVLQSLPLIFVGKSARLSQIVSVVAEAARLSLKKKGMHIAPWRKAEYIKSKWLSSFTRITPPNDVVNVIETPKKSIISNEKCTNELKVEESAELDLIIGSKMTSFKMDKNSIGASDEVATEEEKLDFSVKVPWEPPLVKERSNKVIVTGLASLLKEKS